jgi:hypothetical protein
MSVRSRLPSLFQCEGNEVNYSQICVPCIFLGNLHANVNRFGAIDRPRAATNDAGAKPLWL